MTDDEITKMFNGRWRIFGITEIPSLDTIKRKCYEFFRAGILLSDSPVCDGITVTDSSFEEWWNLYQKKRGKEKCRKKWAKLSAKDRKACIDATPAYVASTPDVVFRKDPYTYLHNKSWQDEVYFKPQQPTQQQRQQERINAAARLIRDYADENR